MTFYIVVAVIIILIILLTYTQKKKAEQPQDSKITIIEDQHIKEVSRGKFLQELREAESIFENIPECIALNLHIIQLLKLKGTDRSYKTHRLLRELKRFLTKGHTPEIPINHDLILISLLAGQRITVNGVGDRSVMLDGIVDNSTPETWCAVDLIRRTDLDDMANDSISAQIHAAEQIKEFPHLRLPCISADSYGDP